MQETWRLILNNFKDITGLDIIFSRNCNMKCSYCYISKNSPDKLALDNNKIREAIINKSFFKNIIKYFNENNKHQIAILSLWGAEPTLNADLFKDFIFDLLTYFTNVNTIMFSTNSLLGFSALNKFISALNEYSKEYNRELSLQLQFSIDGPPYINDKTRYQGAAKNSIKTIFDIINYYNTQELKCHVYIFPKPTLSCDIFKTLGENKAKIIEWYQFFCDIDKQFTEINKNKNINIDFSGIPTLVNPGFHTNEDGKSFALFLQTIRKLKSEDIPDNQNRIPLFQSCFSEFWTHEDARFSHAPGSWYSSHCSAGKNLLSVDYQGNLSLCHRAQDSTYDGNPDYFIWEKNITIYKKTDISRVSYNGVMLHASHEAECHMIKMVLTGMVLSGEINRRYLEDPELLKWLCFFHLGTCCWVGETIDSGSMYVPTQSFIRLFCNGALEEILKYYYVERITNDFNI